MLAIVVLLFCLAYSLAFPVTIGLAISSLYAFFAIAVSGNSGRNTTGPHLHVSCHWGGNKGKYFDPTLILEYITTQLTNK